MHQILSLTGINFQTKSIIGYVVSNTLLFDLMWDVGCENCCIYTRKCDCCIGQRNDFLEIQSVGTKSDDPLKRYVELTLIPSRDNLRHIRLNAKQLRIYRVCIFVPSSRTNSLTFPC